MGRRVAIRMSEGVFWNSPYFKFGICAIYVVAYAVHGLEEHTFVGNKRIWTQY